MSQIQLPYQVINDLNGNPLENGSVYFGTANLNPETNPVAVYWDSALTQPAAQPLKVSNGYIVRNGTPAQIYINANSASITVKDKTSSIVFSLLSFNTTDFSASSGSSLVGFIQSGTGAVAATVQSKLREFVSVKDFGAIEGQDIGVAVNLALAAGAKKIFAIGNYVLSTKILVSGLTGVILDFSQATITAAASLNVSLIEFLNSTYCTIYPGTIDGNASGQSSSSFGISLNGGSYNKIIGGRVTNCKTYGVYQIGCNYAEIESTVLDNNQQCGLGADVGNSDVIGFRVKNVILHTNGLQGYGAISGAQIEGNAISGYYFKELDVSGVVAFNNRGSGITLQNCKWFTISNIQCFDNYIQAISIASCLYGGGSNFAFENNDVAGIAGYSNALSIDDSGVTPASQYLSFFGIYSTNHAGYTVIERGTANNNCFIGVESASDGGIFQTIGVNTVGMAGKSVWGGLTTLSSFTGNGPSSGIGYSTGAGGTVTQTTNKSTGVTLNAPTGRITTANDALAGGAVNAFTLTNSAISSTDILLLNIPSGATPGAYLLNARPANGSAVIEIRNVTGGSLSEAIVISFAVIKGAVS